MLSNLEITEKKKFWGKPKLPEEMFWIQFYYFQIGQACGPFIY